METSIPNACCEGSIKAKYKMPGLGDTPLDRLCVVPPHPHLVIKFTILNYSIQGH